jgi:hypothetical protein
MYFVDPGPPLYTCILMHLIMVLGSFQIIDGAEETHYFLPSHWSTPQLRVYNTEGGGLFNFFIKVKNSITSSCQFILRLITMSLRFYLRLCLIV